MKNIDEHYKKFFIHRLRELRHKKGISAREMSLSLGQSESYINRIETKLMMPSMPVFFYICDYLQTTPEYFFSQERDYDVELSSAIKKIQSLDSKKRKALFEIIDCL